MDKKYITFVVNSVEFGINTECVESISKVGEITHMAGTDKRIAGIIEHRNKPIPVVNLGEILFNNKLDILGDPMMIVCTVEQKSIALEVTNISKMEDGNQLMELKPDSLIASSNAYVSEYLADSNKSIIQVLNISGIEEELENE